MVVAVAAVEEVAATATAAVEVVSTKTAVTVDATIVGRVIILFSMRPPAMAPCRFSYTLDPAQSQKACQ